MKFTLLQIRNICVSGSNEDFKNAWSDLVPTALELYRIEIIRGADLRNNKPLNDNDPSYKKALDVFTEQLGKFRNVILTLGIEIPETITASKIFSIA